jgi:hypothetical protein
MTIPLLPARITELQLAIQIETHEALRPVSRRRQPASPVAEMWAGQIACAVTNAADHRAIVAFLERIDGQVGAFGVTLRTGFASRGADRVSAVAVATTRASPLLEIDAVTGAVDVGTLVSIGDIDTDRYQVVEVVGLDAGRLVVAPRLRYVFPVATPVRLGTVTAKLRLTSDRVDQSARLDRGNVTLDVVEAI